MAAADRRDLEVEGGVLGVAAFFDDILGGGVGRSDLDEEVLLIGLMFAVVSAEAALSVVNHLHGGSFRLSEGWECRAHTRMGECSGLSGLSEY